jgi:predicted Ser/Thr protein kinase
MQEPPPPPSSESSSSTDFAPEDPTATAATGAASDGPIQTPRGPGTLFGRYVVQEELGKGGMSVVYAAYDPELDRRVALKVVRADRLTTQHRARLHREAQALARLSHPNVVTVFDAGDVGNETFVAMELISGKSLRHWVETTRTYREILRVMLAAGRGLAAAHAAGIIHRDVKPDNIVISDAGVVKLVDFGLARDLGDRSLDSHDSSDSGEFSSSSMLESGSLRPLENITQLGHVVGTPAYMAPELRARRTDADQRSDQFSYCATLYEALYRQRPFHVSRKQALDPAEQLTVIDKPSKRTAEIRTMAAAPPKDTDVPGWLQNVITRGLAADAPHRYPTMDALLKALDRDPQRTRRRIGLAVAAIATLVGGTAAITHAVTPSHTATPTCSDGADRIDALWNPKTRSALAASARARGLPWADTAIAAFAHDAEKYSLRWRTMRIEACTATRIRGEQSEEALDLRMACLDRHLAGFGALVSVLGDPSTDADSLRRAGDAVDELPALDECNNAVRLRQVVRPPDDPAVAAQVTQIEGDLARLGALYAVGDVARAAPLGERVVAAARATGYAPVLARALYWLGRTVADRGSADALGLYDETFTAALAAGDDAMAADAAARIAQEELFSAELTQFDHWKRTALALSARTNSEEIELFVDQLACMSNHWTGKIQTRLACLRALAEKRERLGRPTEWLVTTLGLAATESGHPAEAITWLEKGVELSRTENGADHPRTLEMRGHLCRGLDEAGEDERAVAECSDALERLQRIAPDDVALVSMLQAYLASAEKDLGHIDRARELLTKVAAGPDHEQALDAKAMLAAFDEARGGDAKAVVAQRRQSLAAAIELYGRFDPHHPNIIAERHELGVALMAAGDNQGAADELARADADADPVEMNPLALARLRNARSRAIAGSHGDRQLALDLATSARTLFAGAPSTKQFADEIAGLDRWIAELEKPLSPPSK